MIKLVKFLDFTWGLELWYYEILLKFLTNLLDLFHLLTDQTKQQLMVFSLLPQLKMLKIECHFFICFIVLKFSEIHRKIFLYL